MKKIYSYISAFLVWSCKTAGRPTTFMLALTVLLIWLIIGFIQGFTDTWLLVIDTIATINASIMVFIIQNTQNRESKALHIKLDGIIKSLKEAESELIAIEAKEEEEMELIRKKIFK